MWLSAILSHDRKSAQIFSFSQWAQIVNFRCFLLRCHEYYRIQFNSSFFFIQQYRNQPRSLHLLKWNGIGIKRELTPWILISCQFVRQTSIEDQDVLTRSNCLMDIVSKWPFQLLMTSRATRSPKSR